MQKPTFVALACDGVWAMMDSVEVNNQGHWHRHAMALERMSKVYIDAKAWFLSVYVVADLKVAVSKDAY